jgi:AbrB family looped-hinge helix DNA binding protein
MSAAIYVTIDKSGRLVVPKEIREEAGIEPGMPLRISVRDGRVEIEPEYARIRVVEKNGLRVAQLVDPMPPITEKAVRAISHRLRDRRDTR